MLPIESIITEAILGTTDKEVGLCRVSCNAAASSQMFCKCGKCMDQETTVVVTVKTPLRRVVLAFCLACWNVMEKSTLEAAKETETPILVECWNGVIFKQGETDVTI